MMRCRNSAADRMPDVVGTPFESLTKNDPLRDDSHRLLFILRGGRAVQPSIRSGR